jgi:hypothetical protein
VEDDGGTAGGGQDEDAEAHFDLPDDPDMGEVEVIEDEGGGK